MNDPAHSADAKFEPGIGPRFSGPPRPFGGLEMVTLVHVGVFMVTATWAFGGNADRVRLPLAIWGTLGALITVPAIRRGLPPANGQRSPWWWALPIALFNVLVLVGATNPGFRPLQLEGETVLAHVGVARALPTSVVPAEAVRALWLFDAVWLSCFNLVLVIRRRRALRALLLALVINAVVLAVFGTAQKLSGATGLFFGAVPSPQKFFFATFVYHNHWGAFMVLVLGACLGLAWHYSRRGQWRDFLHSPGPATLLTLLLLATTIPLGGSRSCSVLAALLLGIALLHWLVRAVRRRREQRASVAPPLLAATLALVVAAGATWFLARESIARRTADTRRQVSAMVDSGSIGGRGHLYADTWRMAQAKPWFGWGMASYPRVFSPLFNSQRSVDGLPVHFNDAHSDWLQALAEHGFIGTALLAAGVLLPLIHTRRAGLGSEIPRYALLGLLLVGLYAWIEFPFGNLAVMLCWWLLFFAALHYGRLQPLDSNRRSAAAGNA